MKLAAIVRARDWWSYKIPPLMGVAYALVLAFEIPFATGAPALGLFWVFLLATASFGYFLNDLCDIEADRAAQQPNAVDELSVPARVGVLAVLAAFIGLPWLWLPHPPAILGLLGLELALFVAYAVPPLRLKARGIPALFVDALYAHTVPMLLVVTTFASLDRAPGPWAIGPVPAWVVGVIAGWSFLTGFRGILLHQVDDFARDRQARTRTAITPERRIRAVSFVDMVLLPTELGLAIALAVIASTALPYFSTYAAVAGAILIFRVVREARRHRLADPALEDWRLNDELGAGARLRSGTDGAVSVRSDRERTGEPWQIRLRTRPVTLPIGQRHRLYLRVRSDRARPVELALTQTREPWDRVGPYQALELDTDWQRVALEIPALERATQVCLQVNLGGGTGPVELVDVALTRAGSAENLFEDDHAHAPDPVDRARGYRLRRIADYLGSWILNDFYEKWMPLFPLAALVWFEPVYAIVAGVHLLAFRTALPNPGLAR